MTILADKNIRGFDIATDKTMAMDRFQAIQQWLGDLDQLRLRQGAATFEMLLRTVAVLILHDHVDSVVRFENTRRSYDRGAAELGQRTGFGQEASQAPTVAAVLRLRRRINRKIALAHGKL